MLYKYFVGHFLRGRDGMAALYATTEVIVFMMNSKCIAPQKNEMTMHQQSLELIYQPCACVGIVAHLRQGAIAQLGGQLARFQATLQ